MVIGWWHKGVSADTPPRIYKMLILHVSRHKCVGCVEADVSDLSVRSVGDAFWEFHHWVVSQMVKVFYVLKREQECIDGCFFV